MRRIRVLHISDLHARAEWRQDQRELASAMLADAEVLAAQRPFDLVVVSGDLAHAGKRDEYAIAHEILLEPLMQRLALGRESIVLVPGNHDVDRALIDEITELGLAQYLDSRDRVNALLDDETKLAQACRRLEGWEEFRREFYSDEGPASSPPLAQTWQLRLHDTTVGVAALNSAWRCSGDEDRRRLLIGDRQIKNALDVIDDADVRLVAVHHPADWLTTFDEDLAHGLFEQRMTVVLTGHEHRPDPLGVTSSRGQAIYSRAGCLYEKHDYRNAYNVVDVEPDSGEVTISLRVWSEHLRKFHADLDAAEEGIVQFCATRDRLLPVAAPQYTPVLQGLGDIAHEVSVIADRLPDRDDSSIEDLLIARRLWPMPYDEVAAARELDADAAPAPVDAVDMISTGRVLVVSGEAESGVTSALLWLLAQHFERDDQRLPVFVRYDRGLSKASRFERAVRRAAGRVGMSLDRGDELPRMVVAVDDVDVSHKGALDGFLRYVAEHPDQRFILGSHGDDSALAERLDARGIPFDRVYLGPLGRAELRGLIEKLIGHQSPQLLEKVLNVVLSQELPRSPFVLAALVAVLADETDVTTLNVSGLLDAYAKWLLGGDEPREFENLAMDLRRREHLLAWFASVLMRSGRRRVTRQDAERQVLEYYSAKGWSNSSARVLDSLIRRRVLVEDADGIGFRYTALLNLFAGHQMAEDATFAQEMLRDCFEFPGVVQHAAGLRRSDGSLLRAVDEAFQDVLTRLGNDVRVEMFDRVRTRPGWSEDEPDFERLKKAVAEAGRVEPMDDDQLDVFYDHVEAPRETSTADLGLPPLLTALAPAAGLLGTVLRSSELVDDVALKSEVLKHALHAWSLVAIVAALREDQTAEVRERFREEMLGAGADQADVDRFERFMELLLVLMLVMAASASIGSRHLELVLEDVLDDQEFMGDSAHAVFATMLAAHLGMRGWPKRLQALYERHRGHPLVVELARNYALMAYLGHRVSGTEEQDLENFLVDSHVGVPRGSGATAIVQRGQTRSALVAQLRKTRDDAQRQKRSLEQAA